MISLSIDSAQVKRLEEALGEQAKRLSREVQTAVNAVARKVASETAKDLSKVMPLKQKTLKKIVKQKAKATPQKLRAIVGIGEGYPIPLKLHKPTQLKRGVSVLMRKKVKRSILRDAWVAKQWGNRVYKRVGTARVPIVQQYGPKPGEYFAELGTVRKAITIAQTELTKQMERRIRFITLKRAGVI